MQQRFILARLLLQLFVGDNDLAAPDRTAIMRIAYSLIVSRPAGQTVRLHKLVQLFLSLFHSLIRQQTHSQRKFAVLHFSTIPGDELLGGFI